MKNAVKNKKATIHIPKADASYSHGIALARADEKRMCSDTLLQINFNWATAWKEVKAAGKAMKMMLFLTDILRSGMKG